MIIVGYILYQNTSEPVAYKPNIYSYPQESIELEVKIDFPKGGKVIASIPDYRSGWKVKVNKAGKINSIYDYLFYESEQPDNWQHETGWEIEKDKLKNFFDHNMKEYGFNKNEIEDFTEYWIPRLIGHKVYQIYPQEEKVINELISLDLSVEPDNVLRLFYLIKGIDQKENIKKHEMPEKLNREGFVMTEWGGLR